MKAKKDCRMSVALDKRTYTAFIGACRKCRRVPGDVLRRLIQSATARQQEGGDVEPSEPSPKRKRTWSPT